jgi:twinkle protein
MSEEELKRFFDECGANRRIELFDPIVSASPEYILDKIRYMYQARKCTVIFLDHLTYLVDDSDDVRRDLNKLCKGLHDLCVSLGITVIAACHLRKALGGSKGHEEGQRVTLDDLKDSSSIKQLSDIVIGLERDSQSENPLLSNTTTIRVLKNRDFGDKGIACGAVYDKDTTRLQEISGEELAAMKGDDEL